MTKVQEKKEIIIIHEREQIQMLQGTGYKYYIISPFHANSIIIAIVIDVVLLRYLHTIAHVEQETK